VFSASKIRSRGGIWIEMVIAIPVILMLGFGIVEYAAAYWLKDAVALAAQRGAREAIESAATNASVSAAVQEQMQASGLHGKVTYSVTTNPANVLGLPTGYPIEVTVRATWSGMGISVLPTSLGGISGNKQFVVTAVMNKE
jgi:Flp pilus assembly protein TadG